MNSSIGRVEWPIVKTTRGAAAGFFLLLLPAAGFLGASATSAGHCKLRINHCKLQIAIEFAICNDQFAMFNCRKQYVPALKELRYLRRAVPAVRQRGVLDPHAAGLAPLGPQQQVQVL